MCSILRKHLISMACILLLSSAVRVHDSQTYTKMDVTRERISHILSHTTVFFFNCSTTVRAHVVWATSWKRLLGQVRHLAVFSTASPANSYSQNSTSKFEIKLTGQFKSKSLIGSFCFDVLTLLVLPYGAMDKTKHVWRSWGMKRMTHQVIT